MSSELGKKIDAMRAHIMPSGNSEGVDLRTMNDLKNNHFPWVKRLFQMPVADLYSGLMCGRVVQSNSPLRYAFIDGMNVRDSRVSNYPPRWNAAPSQELLVIRRNHQTGRVSLDPLRWGLIPNWCKDPTGGRKQINAKAETVSNLPTFREAYRKRRCILPVDGFFEWKAIKGRAKQPFAIAMKDASPFGIAGIWENWKDLSTGEWVRTFAIITTDANSLVAQIHDRMPAILSPTDYSRWLSDEPDPRDLLRPFSSEPMRMWAISTRVNKPENDEASILEEVELTCFSLSPRRASARRIFLPNARDLERL
jgi:putative SOS response-associated peptidase YedK